MYTSGSNKHCDASMYTHSRDCEAQRRNDDTVRVDVEVRLSTARKERRSSTSGSRNQVVARNPLVSYHRDFEAAHISYTRKNLFKSSATDEDNQITLNAESALV